MSKRNYAINEMIDSIYDIDVNNIRVVRNSILFKREIYATRIGLQWVAHRLGGLPAAIEYSGGMESLLFCEYGTTFRVEDIPNISEEDKCILTLRHSEDYCIANGYHMYRKLAQ